MKSIYKISRGQLVTIWVFGFIGLFFTLQPALDEGSGFAFFFLVFIPFVLIFYTVGWRNHKKINVIANSATSGISSFGVRGINILKILLKILLPVGVVLGLVIWGVYYIQNRPQVATGLFGIEFDMTPLEVKLKLGEPNLEVSSGDSGDLDASLPRNITYEYRDYLEKGEKYIRFYEENGEYRVSIICNIFPEYYDNLLGIGTYSTEEDVIKRFGEPSSTSIRFDGLAKTIVFEEWKVGFEFEKGEITKMCVTKSGGLKYNEEYGVSTSTPQQ